jgi:iron complex outermembrane receptor protein
MAKNVRACLSVLALSIAASIAGGCRSASDLPAAATPAPSPEALKTLSLAQLMDIEITSVSRQPRPLSDTAAAVQVLTNDDIRRSGARTLAEALRLAPNLQVAQVSAYDWAVTSRGFNGASVNTGSLANKLLVMIDGRTVYTPLFGGVFWDAQQVSLDDVDRIEVVSGPAGTLWGANAVNGVINIVTKNAAETQGGKVHVAFDSASSKAGALRYGGTVGPNFSYRAHGQRMEFDDTTRQGGLDAHDDWALSQGGFRTDYRRSATDNVTVQGDFYVAREASPSLIQINGQNAIARWTHITSPESEWSVQVYTDRTVREFPRAAFREELRTADLDAQQRFTAGRHGIVWGFGYRHMWDDVRNGPSFTFLPAQRTMRLASGFVQDDLALPSSLKLTVGTKVEHNDFSGFEVQPSIRLAWTPPGISMAWGALSRAVRSPARIDTDITTRTSRGNPDFLAENVTAYELGYRIRPADSVSLSIAAFHNVYSDLRSINHAAAQPGVLVFDNDLRAATSGVELSAALHLTSQWRMRGGYTHVQKQFHATSANVFPFSDAFEAQDPRNQIVVQSVMDLPRGVQFDVVARHIGEIPATLLGPRIASYTTADVRLAWSRSRWEVAAVGQNLDGGHPEFVSPILWYEIPRTIRGEVSFTW